MGKNVTIKFGYAENERPGDNTRSDYQWIHANRKTLYRKYGKGVAYVYQQVVIGFGPGIIEAEENTRANMASLEHIPDDAVITPVSVYLGPFDWPRLRVVREEREETDQHDAH